MGLKVKGIQECKDNLDAVIDDVAKRKAVRAVNIAILIGGTRAAYYTPIDTSFLLNSQYREVSVKGTLVTGRVGYSANYAVYVHDPNIPMKFKRPSAKKEFLYKGFEDEMTTIDAKIKEEMAL